MRIYKFRAWHEEDQVMIYDLNSPRLFHGVLQKDDYILMQFTGLLDQYGHEIYEGDILTYVFMYGISVSSCDITVIFQKGSFGYELFDQFGESEFIALNTEKYKIIGNIYQNPELLKET